MAAGLVPLAIGTDTAGSVRNPASACGIVGLKTTIGRVSRAGVYPLCWTLDSVGPITRSVEDAALVYQAMQGADPREVVIGVSPAFGIKLFRTVAGHPLSSILRELVAGISRGGAVARIVRMRHTADTSFLGLSAMGFKKRLD